MRYFLLIAGSFLAGQAVAYYVINVVEVVADFIGHVVSAIRGK